MHQVIDLRLDVSFKALCLGLSVLKFDSHRLLIIRNLLSVPLIDDFL